MTFGGIAMSSANSCKKYIYIDVHVSVLSERHLKPHERFFISIYNFYQTDLFLGRKGGTAVAVRKGIPHNDVDLPPLVSVDATGVWISVGNSGVLLAAVCKSPGHAWNDADVVEILRFRRKSLLAEDLNAKHPFWNSVVTNPSGEKLLDLLHVIEFHMSAPHCCTHYCPA
jgi:hypothetical protein